LAEFSFIDYVFVALMIGSFLMGWARGFVAVLTGFAAFLATMFLAGRYTDTLVRWLNQTWQVQERFAEVLKRRLELPEAAHQVPASVIPWDKAMQLLAEVPLPNEYRAALAQEIAEWSQSAGTQTIAEFITQQLAAGVVSGLAFTILAMGVGWGLSLLGRLISSKVTDLPLIGGLNRILGGATLLLQTSVVLAVVVAIAIPMVAAWGFRGVGPVLEESYMAPYLLRYFEWLKGLLLGSGSTFFLAP
jgi:hypothetical protein